MLTVAKRRSSTRVGRNHPRPTPVRPPASKAGGAAYLRFPPVVLGGAIYRVLQSASDQYEVQEWDGSYWLPSLLPLYRLQDSLIAPRLLLDQAGVPQADRLGSGRVPHPRDLIPPNETPR